jgi:hypothetical protein
MNKVPNGTHVILQIFGERETLPNQTRNPLTQGIVESFNMISLTSLFANSTMTFTGNYCFVRLPKIGISDSALSINTG